MAGKRIDAESQRRQWEAWRAGEERRLNALASMPDGSCPAWEVARQMPGMTSIVFELRISRGWSPERAATEPVKRRRSKWSRFRGSLGPDDE